ncbi:MAG: FAD-binding oxidoreductase [Bacillota bacterium]|nr:FAD-binding oxidoreductase [Bacillota bacterium]
MKKYAGIVLIILSSLLTIAFWSFEQPVKTISVYRQVSQLIASIALLNLMWINYISTRHSLIDRIFNGLDKSYIYHKYLSILVIALIWFHNLTVGMGGHPGGFKQPGGFRHTQAGGGLLGISGREFGSLSLAAFTGFVLIFLITNRLEYQKWKLSHKLMLIPYAFGIFHYYTTADYAVFSLSAYTLWMNFINAVGILSAFYSIFLYEKTAFKYHYRVSEVREIAKGTIEITGMAEGAEMKYKSGQFAFIKILGKKKGFPSHPFSISQAHKTGQIQFSIKSLGDHTGKLKSLLSKGDIIAVSGPYGKFNYLKGIKHQVWIAGGIGITPFRSFLQTEIPSDYSIDFFYAYNNEEEGAYIEELKAYEQRNNIRIHLIDSSKSGFLGKDQFNKYLSRYEKYDVFFCGPKAMRINIRKQLINVGYKINFRYEQFQFK